MKHAFLTVFTSAVVLFAAQITFAQSTSAKKTTATTFDKQMTRSASLVQDSKQTIIKKDKVTLPTGKVLTNAFILDKRPNGLTLGHDGGAVFVPFSDMPVEAQKYFNYDPVKSAAYEKELAKSRKAAAKAEQQRKADEEESMKKSAARMKDYQIFRKRQQIKETEMQISEIKRKNASMDRNVERNRSERFSLATASSGGHIATPFGLSRGGRNHVTRILNETKKETQSMEMRRDNYGQDLIQMELRLEAQKHELDLMLKDADTLFGQF